MIHRLLTLLMAVVCTYVLVSLLLLLNGYSPIATANTSITSTWGAQSGLVIIFTKAALLIMTGLAVAIPYRAGLFNIGGEGQLYLGGIVAAGVGLLPLNGLYAGHWILCLILGTLAGATWASIAAWFKTKRNIHEVISTIMLNFIAFQFVNEMTFHYMSAGPGTSRTAYIQSSAQMPVLFRLGAAWTSWGIVLTCLLACFLSWALYKTWTGYQIRAVGSNPKASAYAGISVGRNHTIALMIGGGCAGLAGALETVGISHAFYGRFKGGYGFDGIAVAFLALCEPWATIPAAFVIATLRASDRALQFELGVPKELVFMLEGILIICIAIFSRWRKNV